MIISLDVGGTSMKGAVFTAGLDRIASLRRPTPHGDAAVGAVLETVDELIERAAATPAPAHGPAVPAVPASPGHADRVSPGRTGPASPGRTRSASPGPAGPGDAAGREPSGAARAIGLAVPGVVDDERGVAVWSENIGWRDVPFRELIERRTGLRVAIGHDVRAGGTAELRLGAARGARNALIMPIGTGIAAAVVVDGHLCVGDGYAGEIGHMAVSADEPCVCGGTGCLEAAASGPGIARRYARRTGREATADAIAALVAEGDPDATAVWTETVGLLGEALAAATAIAAPEVIVIGGGLSRAGDLLLRPLADDLHARLTFHRRPRLTTAHFGDEAGCVGAAIWARDLLEHR